MLSVLPRLRRRRLLPSLGGTVLKSTMDEDREPRTENSEDQGPGTGPEDWSTEVIAGHKKHFDIVFKTCVHPGAPRVEALPQIHGNPMAPPGSGRPLKDPLKAFVLQTAERLSFEGRARTPGKGPLLQWPVFFLAKWASPMCFAALLAPATLCTLTTWHPLRRLFCCGTALVQTSVICLDALGLPTGDGPAPVAVMTFDFGSERQALVLRFLLAVVCVLPLASGSSNRALRSRSLGVAETTKNTQLMHS
ncbi:hypothetical protein AK812_SmicGene14553 [Symbiodinium microadriaticum]|uniref:Uncharacterized protein n=1 Tax=Symbiodinium microadriaticum TaxID=2951 RepID=A0A1Q9E567_SYMMI|nr:hypothetical protein AK812_SmicGene14553 [Symbiodinium microadriaticum]